MKNAGLLCFVFLLSFISCKKADTTAEDVPLIEAPATAKLIIVTGRIDNSSSTSTFYSNCITAYEADGTLAWKNANIGNGFTEPRPYYSKGILYFFTLDYNNQNFLIALDAKTGSLLWKITNSSERLLGLSFYNDTMYCSSTGSGNYISAFLARTGDLLWTLPIASTEPNALTETNGSTLYFRTGYSSNFNALDLNTRTIKWTAKLDGPATYAGLRFLGNQLFVNTGKSVTELNKSDGVPRWSKTAGSISSFCAGNNMVYITETNVALYALDAATGSIRWQNSDYSKVYTSSPFLEGGTLFFGSVDNISRFYMSLNASTGNINWRHNYEAFYSQNIPMGDNIYALKNRSLNNASLPSYLIRFDSKTGVAKDSIALAADEVKYLSILNSADELITPF